MDIIIYNTFWMTFNVSLAVIAVILGWLIWKTKSRLLKIPLGILWLIFVPNTIYIVTDLLHLHEQWNAVVDDRRVILVLQYLLLVLAGVVTFLLAIFPIEKTLEKTRIKKDNNRWNILFVIWFINFLIGFGVIMGRFHRTNTWEVFTNPEKVVGDGLRIFTSGELLALVILVGLICNIIYFLFNRVLSKVS